MYIPTTSKEIKERGWDKLDVILVTGDSYIDSPFFGSALIGKILLDKGFKVGIIAQPDTDSPADITRLGEPNLFWGVTAGSLDSMVANYTALKKFRKSDDYTPGGKNTKRPDRATIVYTNLIKQYFKDTAPIVLGGIEASLRRIAHYDFWDNRIRRSVLFDAKADYLLYGMGDRSIVDLARALKNKQSPEYIRGLCYISAEPKYDYIQLPAYQEVKEYDDKFIAMFDTFYKNCDPLNAQGLYQKMDTRYLVQNPPAYHLTSEELDQIYGLAFEHQQHPYYRKEGKVRALDTISNSIPTHRGCFGECNFCAIAVHEGRRVRWRTESSILQEARSMRSRPGFKGNIKDLCGPTANMYGMECQKMINRGSCKDRRCLYPSACGNMQIDHSKQTALIQKLRKIPGIKKIFVSSGIRFDMVMADKKHGQNYLKEVASQHTSGQLKIAPEHTAPEILKLMGKPPRNHPLYKFRDKFFKYSKQAGKQQYLTYYFIAAHPGCTDDNMHKLKDIAAKKLKINPRQVQIFTPTPSTWSSVMYYTEKNPFTGQKIFVEKNPHKKRQQKKILQ
ncbi:MAG: YgiQ family radical SAM protein [Candidatus Marinimicrobia bacterium]|nr:YgiQ family radical SAM protein [Candidatus Neomarinimicrobiota bacterium]